MFQLSEFPDIVCEKLIVKLIGKIRNHSKLTNSGLVSVENKFYFIQKISSRVLETVNYSLVMSFQANSRTKST